MSDQTSVDPYDAVLLVSFGGPERAEDVLPFLENVTRGRGVPRERLVAVAEHYDAFGGQSPINDQCRALVRAVEADLGEHGIDIPVYWGNRNWDPYLTDAVERMRLDGIRRAAAFVTSAYASYSGCRQYRENLYDAVAAMSDAPHVDKLRHYFNHPGFVAAFVDTACEALAELPHAVQSQARLVFVTHSIPTAMAGGSGPDGDAYVDQHRFVAESVAHGVRERTGVAHTFEIAYCSRSGPPAIPWLEPDVNDHLEGLAGDGVEAVVMVPIGFVSDHMEVMYDLDTEAAATAERLGLAYRRASTPGVHPAFVSVARDLLVERAVVESGRTVGRATVGSSPPSWDVCQPDCCPNLREKRPALCESDQ